MPLQYIYTNFPYLSLKNQFPLVFVQCLFCGSLYGKCVLAVNEIWFKNDFKSRQASIYQLIIISCGVQETGKGIFGVRERWFPIPHVGTRQFYVAAQIFFIAAYVGISGAGLGIESDSRIPAGPKPLPD